MLVALGLLVVVASLGSGGRATANHVSMAEAQGESSSADAAPRAVSASGFTMPADPSVAPSTAQAPPSTGRATAALTSGETTTVEELLDEGLHRAGASPVHLAIRGTPAADSVRCAWRGITRTAQQREDAIRFWLRLGADATIPETARVEAVFMAVLETLDPEYRETAKANFLVIARGGLSMDYLFLTCLADYAVTGFLLGTGTTPPPTWCRPFATTRRRATPSTRKPWPT